jgi:hypothetical protein
MRPGVARWIFRNAVENPLLNGNTLVATVRRWRNQRNHLPRHRFALLRRGAFRKTLLIKLLALFGRAVIAFRPCRGWGPTRSPSLSLKFAISTLMDGDD